MDIDMCQIFSRDLTYYISMNSIIRFSAYSPMRGMHVIAMGIDMYVWYIENYRWLIVYYTYIEKRENSEYIHH